MASKWYVTTRDKAGAWQPNSEGYDTMAQAIGYVKLSTLIDAEYRIICDKCGYNKVKEEKTRCERVE